MADTIKKPTSATTDASDQGDAITRAVETALTRGVGFYSTPDDGEAIALINALQAAGLDVRAVWSSVGGKPHHIFYHRGQAA